MQKNMESIQEELGDLVVKSDIGGGWLLLPQMGGKKY